ncbi:MAG: glycosyltransferase family 2 protein [Candidatus Weimeria sp.]
MVSVIVPVYNGAGEILRCLESVRAQSYSDFECLIIDDGSTDDSYSVIENYLNDDRFHLYHQDNAGVAVTRNRGISYAKGDFLAFVDQDDYVSPEYLRHLVEKADDETDIVVTGYKREDEKGKELFSVPLSDKSWSRFVMITPWTHLYRKSFVEKNGISFLPTNFGEDIYFNMMAYLRTDRVKIVPDTCDYVWVYNTSSVSNTLHKRADHRTAPVALLDRIMQDSPKKWAVPYEDFEYYMVRFCIWYCLNVMRQSTVEENVEAQNGLFGWLGKNFPDYQKNRYLKKKPEGEKGKYHLAVKGYMILKKSGMLKIITDIFSRKEKR